MCRRTPLRRPRIRKILPWITITEKRTYSCRPFSRREWVVSDAAVKYFLGRRGRCNPYDCYKNLVSSLPRCRGNTENMSQHPYPFSLERRNRLKESIHLPDVNPRTPLLHYQNAARQMQVEVRHHPEYLINSTIHI